jgi:hypothetical protein
MSPESFKAWLSRSSAWIMRNAIAAKAARSLMARA